MEKPAVKSKQITEMLQDWSDGNREALEMLLPLVYDELHRQPLDSCAANVPDTLCKRPL